MKKILCSMLAVGLIGLVGCKEGTSQAPPKAGQVGDQTKPRKLSVTSPGGQVVMQDQTDELTVSVTRENLTSPVSVELRDLPNGVKVTTQDMTIPAGKDSITVTIKADSNATVAKDHVVKVAAKAKDEKDLPEAITDFKLDVKAK